MPTAWCSTGVDSPREAWRDWRGCRSKSREQVHRGAYYKMRYAIPRRQAECGGLVLSSASWFEVALGRMRCRSRVVVERDARGTWSKRCEFVRVRCGAGVWMDGDGCVERIDDEQVCRVMDGETREEGRDRVWGEERGWVGMVQTGRGQMSRRAERDRRATERERETKAESKRVDRPTTGRGAQRVSIRGPAGREQRAEMRVR